MFVILIALFVGVVAYLLWQWNTTTLTRDCRWRLSRSEGAWHCVACGAEVTDGEGQPTDCYRKPKR